MYKILNWHLWPSTTKWGSLRGVSKLRKVYVHKHFLYTFWCNDYSVIFLSITRMLETTRSYKNVENNFTKIWDLKDCNVHFYLPIKKQMFHNTSFLPHFRRKLCLVWWRYRKNISKKKKKILTFVHFFFAYITQNQYYSKGPHLVILGHNVSQQITKQKWN